MQKFIPMLYMCAVLLVPIIPAYLIYRVLPSDLTVSGPFNGLTVKLTGAFAGYFLLVVVASGFAYHAMTPAKPTYEVWEIVGKVEPRDAPAYADGGAADAIGTTIGIRPPTFMIGSTGEFSMTVIVKPGHVEGQRHFPTLEFVRSGYEAVIMPLGPAGDVEVDEQSKLVRFKKAVPLNRLKTKQVELQWER